MSEEMVYRKRRLSSFQIIILGFAGVILLGALLLMLPRYTNSGGRGEQRFMKWRYAPGCCGKRQHQQQRTQQNDPGKAQYDNLKRRKAVLSAKHFFRHHPHSL